MSAIDDILSAAKLPETTVRIPLPDPALADEHQRLDAELKALGEFDPSSIGEANPRHDLAARLTEIEAEMKASEVPFKFRALGRRKYRELIDAHPGEDGQRFEVVGFSRALISACCVDPLMTPTDVDRLFDVLNEFAVEVLFMAAYSVNEGPARVPFSAAASELMRKQQPN